MKRFQLRNKFVNTRSDLGIKACNEQRNYVVSLLRKERKEFYGNVKTNALTESRISCKTVQSFFPDKTKTISTITLIEDKKMIL